MATLALVYTDITKHVLSATLVQSAYSQPPLVSDLVGTGPVVRDLLSQQPAVHVDATAVQAKVLELNPAKLDRQTLEGVLANPLGYFVTGDPQSTTPLSPVTNAANVQVNLSATPATLTVSSPSPPPLLFLVVRQPKSGPPTLSPAGTTVGGTPQTQTASLGVDTASGDWLLVLVATQQAQLKAVP